MSRMKDLWDDTIEVLTEDGYVHVSFTEARPHDTIVIASMELDVPLARKFAKKLKKAIAEMEDA